NFSQLGTFNRNRLAKVSMLGTGGVDPSWDPDVAGGNLGYIASLAFRDHDLYLGGSFDRVGSRDRRNIARVGLNGVGTAEPRWGSGTDKEMVYALLVSGDALYAGGSFSQIAEQSC